MPENNYHINDDLLVKHLLGETSGAEADAVESWLAADEINRRHYAGLEWVWQQSLQLAEDSSLDEEQAWSRFRDRVGSRPRVVPLYRRPAFRVAAVLLIMLAAAFVGLRLLNDSPMVKEMAFITTDSSLAGSLPDGSLVTLNKDSRLSYPSKFTGASRPVTLEGEAFFNVQPDREKPFIIQVNDVSIRVVGTSFNVKAVGGFTEVIVETGIVQVTRNGKTVELRAAEKLKTVNADSSLQKQEVTDRLYNYYRTREFECDGTPLWKLVEVLNEAYEAKIVISRDGLRSEQISTTFNNEPLEKVLEVVSATLGLKVEHRGDSIILK